MKIFQNTDNFYLLFLFLVFFGLLKNILYFLNVERLFWDLDLYQIAINEFLDGGDAYGKLEGSLRFVYSPYVLIFFSWFGKTLQPILIVFYFVSIILFFKSKIGRELLMVSMIASVLFWNEFSPLNSIITGSITIFAHLLIIACFSLKFYGVKILYLFFVVFFP